MKSQCCHLIDFILEIHFQEQNSLKLNFIFWRIYPIFYVEGRLFSNARNSKITKITVIFLQREFLKSYNIGLYRISSK